MSSELAGLMSATFHEAGYAHLVELVQAYDAGGQRRAAVELDPGQEILDLDALLDGASRAHGRLLVVFDARYDPRIFPYRPHHYAYLHRRDAQAPPLYYAVNATLGGVPDRIGAVALNNFES